MSMSGEKKAIVYSRVRKRPESSACFYSRYFFFFLGGGGVENFYNGALLNTHIVTEQEKSIRQHYCTMS